MRLRNEVVNGVYTCPKCGSTTNGFYKANSRVSGLDGICKLCRNALNKKWRADTKEARATYAKEYHRNHREQDNTKTRQWKAENPEKEKQYRHKRRAKKEGAGGFFTAEEWFTLCFAVSFRCLCCNEIKPLTPDHVIPISKGGTSWLWNIQPLCITCNKNKGQKTTDYRYPNARDYTATEAVGSFGVESAAECHACCK